VSVRSDLACQHLPDRAEGLLTEGKGRGLTSRTVVYSPTTEMRSEKCVVMRFRRCANVIECIYTNLDSIADYTPSLYGIAYCSQATNLYSMLLY
jgi:hypothetical protein